MMSSPRSRHPVFLTAGAVALAISVAHAQGPRGGHDEAARGAAGRTKETRTVSRQQIEDAEARVAVASAIVKRLEQEARARGLASGWRQVTLESLLPLSLEGLRHVEQQAFTLDGLTAALSMADEDPRLLGDRDKDLVYTPITPCRYIDTRIGAGKIAGTRSFDIFSDGSRYGGDAACNLPVRFNVRDDDDIGALAMNVTVVDTSAAAAPGFLAIKPTAASPTTSLLNWYEQGAHVQIANQGIVSLHQTDDDEFEFAIQTSGAVHVVVDIFGGFVHPQATALDTQHLFAFTTVPHSSSGSVQSPVCPAGFTLTGGGCFTADVGHRLELSYPGGGDNRWACRSFNISGVSSNLFARAICARVPGR